MATKIKKPFYPIIYVRGYAMTQGEIESAVASPYMGFNEGSAKLRQSWDGNVRRHIFESPLIRLMKEYGYTDYFHNGTEVEGAIPTKSIIIYRYYEQGSKDLGTDDTPSIPETAKGLNDLILKIKEQVCGTSDEARRDFKVYLVAHSMGGLVCRCFLQNDAYGTPEARTLVDKVFTYATPHNGIDISKVNVPRFLQLFDIDNFNKKNMAKYLTVDYKANGKRVDTLDGKFDPNRFFCLVGTNATDYTVAMGASKALLGAMGDGLVQIKNAAVQGAPRAFVYRSHSGHFGIVNSESGYQNLVRFLFGNVRVDGLMKVDNLPLPREVQKYKDRGSRIRASYIFEVELSPRGAMNYELTNRTATHYSAIFRTFDEMMRPDSIGRNSPRYPRLFSTYLNQQLVPNKSRTLVFGVSLGVKVPEYEVDRFIFDKQIPGEFLYRATLVIRATPPRNADEQWTVRYIMADEQDGSGQGRKAKQDGGTFLIPLKNKKGFRGTLELKTSLWE